MRGATATAFVVGLLATSNFGLTILAERDSLPAVIGLQTQRRDVKDPIARDALRKRGPLRKRQTVSQTLDNEEALYFANVTIGTPSTNFRLHIDTGSSDMWVNTPTSQICQLRRNPCTTSGTYSANSSSSYKYVASDFNVSYVDGTGASGDYVTDDIGIGGKTLKALQFGVGYISTTPEGILGIGYQNDEGLLSRGGKEYSNLPMAMVNGGFIKSNAFSIWLDDMQANTGSILFGGVDTNKYHGSLQSLPVQKKNNVYAEFIITLSGMSLSNGGQNTSLSTGLPAPVVLDTGSSITYLPNNLAQAVFNALNVQYSSRQGAGYADCNLAKQNIAVEFVFTTVTISVPISELIINPSNTDTGNGEPFSGDEQLCLFGITSAQGETAVLGDSFLRSAYVVFDIANNEVSLAQTNFNSTTASVSEIGTGTNSVPGASAVANPVQAAATTTAGSRVGAPTSTATSKSGAVELQIPYTALTVLGLIAGILSCV